jgi:hypothetical protein
MNRTDAMLLAAALCAAPAAAHADYCSEIKAMGIEGKYVVVTSSLGDAAETKEGQVVSIQAGVLTLNPVPDVQGVQPLYDGGKIIEPVKTRIYFNCQHVISVTVDPLPIGR